MQFSLLCIYFILYYILYDSKTCINPVELYGTEIILEYRKVIENLEKVQRRYMRNLIGVIHNVANEALLTEIDLKS
jgi:hypothetical protein